MSQPEQDPEVGAAPGAENVAGPAEVGGAIGLGATAIGAGQMDELNAVANSGGEAGRFEYTEEQLRSIMNRWKALAEEYQEDVRIAEPLRRIVGPGDEYVSARYALAANASGEQVIRSLKERRDYCWAQARKCAEALGEYVETEDEAAREMKKPDGPVGPV
ncbi:hypothetical protein EV191_103244 [Tamaricihabitans halophyticus]|uniref:PE family protein n=1 Tax=Tamaricihabitans halophyticus TaxID=1262583 RepID=A0A4R2R3U0_9PSEU|nr:hypothetical protein [Tamaricihabitans halophyticus]TCP54201.1 hypothetical protein EV191_103244 [Tamaricihabitans halophyticus]